MLISFFHFKKKLQVLLGLSLGLTLSLLSFSAISMTSADADNDISVKRSSIVGHYFGIFDDEWEVSWHDRVREDTPFELVDYLYIAFAHSYEDPDAPGKYILSYENARHGEVGEGDTDADRIEYLVEQARAKNPEIKILISLGWGLGDIAVIAFDPEHYADSVVEFIQDNELDGFDLDFEPPNLPAETGFTNISQTIRAALDQASEDDDRGNNPYLFTVTPSTTSGFKNWDELSTYYDFVNLQTYWSTYLLTSFLNAGVPSEKITLGVLSEGYAIEVKPEDIDVRVDLYEQNNLAGIFSWRLDTDTLLRTSNKPTYGFAEEMWASVNQG